MFTYSGNNNNINYDMNLLFGLIDVAFIITNQSFFLAKKSSRFYLGSSSIDFLFLLFRFPLKSDYSLDFYSS